jgi:hypothetical protein
MCRGAHVLVPCPVKRSVTFSVVLGECNCPEPERMTAWHDTDCPARPVKVSCSISGSTWEESEVSIAEIREAMEEDTAPAPMIAMGRARDRWELIKALVLGKLQTWNNTHDVKRLIAQRDAVFAALADMAKAEEAHAAAYSRAMAAMGRLGAVLASERKSINVLAICVSRLIEQVGVL